MLSSSVPCYIQYILGKLQIQNLKQYPRHIASSFNLFQWVFKINDSQLFIVKFIINMKLQSNEQTGLYKSRLTKRKKQERLYELQRKFNTRKVSSNDIPSYDALGDDNALNYFVSKPMKKHLKKLIKVSTIQNRNQAVNKLPMTPDNKKLLKSLQQITNEQKSQLQNSQNQKLNDNNEPNKEHINGSGKQMNKISIESNKSRAKIASNTVFYPYLQVLKPSDLKKGNLLKYEALLQKKKMLLSKQLGTLPFIKPKIKEKNNQLTLSYKKNHQSQRLKSLDEQRRSPLKSDNLSRIIDPRQHEKYKKSERLSNQRVHTIQK